MRTSLQHNPRQRRRGYTLVEILVVILIILIVSAATLPAVLPAVTNRRIGDATNMIHAELSAAHDRAVRYNKPQGVRLIPDPIDQARPDVRTASKLIALDIGPDYTEGFVDPYFNPWGSGLYNPYTIQYISPGGSNSPPTYTMFLDFIPANPNHIPKNYPYLILHEDKFDNALAVNGNPMYLPNSPTMWYWNIRQGDKIRINATGATYTIAGPIANPAGNNLPNPERFINFGASYYSLPTPATSNVAPAFEFLYLMNGQDDDTDGIYDEGFDGIDNDGDGVIDPGFNGIDDNGNGQIDEWYEVYYSRAGGTATYHGCPLPTINSFWPKDPMPYPNEYEPENFGGSLPGAQSQYTIARRPVPSQSARIINLPSNVVIDMTTWNTTQERSRLPIDPYSGNVDIMFAPDGHVLALNATANPAPQFLPYYHFWVADIEDVQEPRGTTYPSLPVDADEIMSGSGYSRQTMGTLEGERRLLTINTKTGSIVSNAIEAFSLTDPNYVYEPAQSGSTDTP